MVTLISLVAVVAVAVLAFNLYRRFANDKIAEMNNARRAASRIVSRGEFVDGNRHLEVALALSDSTFFYENADMQASLDLERIREIEYDNELATGAAVDAGSVLRLRSGSQTFEFVVPADMVTRWKATLPATSEVGNQERNVTSAT